jgi:rhodanese-related sulfurtransferase
MAQITTDRRRFLVALTGGAGLVWLAASSNPRGTEQYKVPEVSIARAKELLQAGAIAIDVRDEEKFAYRHLPNAVLIPLVALRAAIPLSLSEAKAKPIIVYCNRGLAHGPEATQLLLAAGYSHAMNLASGIEGWAEAGMPVEHG